MQRTFERINYINHELFVVPYCVIMCVDTGIVFLALMFLTAV